MSESKIKWKFNQVAGLLRITLSEGAQGQGKEEFCEGEFMGICWMQSGTGAWCGDCCDLACCQTKPWGQQKVVIESTCVALTALSSCVNTGYKNWLCLQFSLIHYSALDIQGVNEKLSSGFAFGDPGCYTGLGGFSKDWFVEFVDAESLGSLLFCCHLSFKALFSVSRVSPASGIPDTARRPWWQSLPACPGGDANHTRHSAEDVATGQWGNLPRTTEGNQWQRRDRKINSQKRPDHSHQECWLSGVVVVRAPGRCSVWYHTWHTCQASRSFQELFLFCVEVGSLSPEDPL